MYKKIEFNFLFLVASVCAIPTARDLSWPCDLTTPFPYSTPSPIDVDASEVNITNVPTESTAIRITILQSEGQLVTNTGYDITAVPTTPNSANGIEGGFLKSRYTLVRTTYFWSDNVNEAASSKVDGRSTPLQVRFVNKNIKYPTFEEALRHRDGLVILAVDVRVEGDVVNPDFIPLCQDLAQLQNVGRTVFTTFTPLYLWLQRASFFRNYFAYPGAYIDVADDKRLYDAATVLVVPSYIQPRISVSQFQSFLNIRNATGCPYDNTLVTAPRAHRPVIQGESVQIITFP